MSRRPQEFAAQDPAGWSAAPFLTTCSEHLDRYFCEGACCETGSCCNAAGTCEASRPGCVGCTMGGRFSGDGARNPADLCQQCRAERSTTDWSAGENGVVCEVMVENGVFSGNRVCCEGVCCDLYGCCSGSGICGATNCQ